MKSIILKSILLLLFSSLLFTQNKEELSKDMNTDFIHWYGQAAFRIEDGKTQIYIDPFRLPDSIEFKADIIFITHAHMDHFSPDDIEKIRKKTTIFIATEDVAKKLKDSVITIKPSETIEIGNIKVEAVPAYNINKNFHPRANNWIGYVIKLANGLSVYHAGDTDAVEEIKKIKTDIAMVPIGGKYTMTAEEAAGIINEIKPRVAIPMHYGSIVGNLQDAEHFKKLSACPVIIKSQEK